MLLSYLLSIAATVTHVKCAINEAAFASADIINKDVAIIGGGASGTYAAVRLREDLNKSIIVIEKDNRFGGHVNTYFDPVSKASIDYGVLAYLRYGNSAAFFERFNIPITPFVPQSGGQTTYVNSADGSLLSSYTPPSFPAAAAAIAKWVNVTSQYTDHLLPGLWNFWSPSKIPSDLLLPFGEFATRYGLQACTEILTEISNVGVGGLKDVLTLYVYFAFGQPVSQEFLDADLFMPKGLSNSELYNRALNLLRSDVMLQSQVVSSERTNSGVKLVVQGPNGHQKLIKAKRLLFTPPPSLDRLAPFDLDAKEKAPLTTWTGTWSFAAMARIPAIPGANTTVLFTSPSATPAKYLNIRDMPFTLSLASANQASPSEHLFEVLFATNYSISYADAKAAITAAVGKMTSSHGAFANATDKSVEFVAFNDHNSVLWRQSPAQLKSGIVQDIYSLQGRRSTWYTGGLWSEDYTGNVWAFTEDLLPRMLKGI
ncbi:MAG: hypothetical protein Q9227_003357 [Pyrenula ochraceoflavens]